MSHSCFVYIVQDAFCLCAQTGTRCSQDGKLCPVAAAWEAGIIVFGNVEYLYSSHNDGKQTYNNRTTKQS